MTIDRSKVDLDKAIDLLEQANFYICTRGELYREDEMSSFQLSDEIDDFLNQMKDGYRTD